MRQRTRSSSLPISTPIAAVDADATSGQVEQIVLADERVPAAFAGTPVRRLKVVPGRIVNIVVG